MSDCGETSNGFDPIAEREAIWEAFRHFVSGMVELRHRDECLSTVADTIVGVGMGEQGVYFNKEEYLKILNAITKETSGLEYDLEYGRHEVVLYPTASATVLSEIKVSGNVEGNAVVSRVVQMANMIRREDGRWLVSSASCAPLTMSQESIHALPLRFAENTIAQLKDELQAEAVELLNTSIPGGMISFYNSPGYPINFINAQMLAHIGCSQLEFESRFGGKFINLVHPDDRDMVGRAIDESLARGNEYEVRHRISGKNGGIAWVIQRGRKTKEATEPALLMSVFTDVTEIINLQNDLVTQAKELADSLEMRKLQEKRLQEAVAAAREASRAKSTFLATMSHEIRTPMNGVIGFAELAMEDSSLPQRSRDYIRKIRQSAVGLLGIINDILDISKIESGRMESECIPFRLSEVVQQCELTAAVRAAEKGVRFVTESDMDDKIELLGDPTKLRQILVNLLSNAVKFTKKGSATLRIRANELVHGGVSVYFEVVDTGIGMTPEEVGRIFQPFVQADNSTTRQYGGTGLGLAISKSYIEMMGGKLNVESCPGAGSRFSFTLEFERTSGMRSRSDTGVDVKVLADSRPVFSGSILVCEDNDMNRDVIRDHLAQCGLEADMAVNGRAGVEMIRKRTERGGMYDLVFMDIYMPVMDGLDATREILGLGVSAPIVALTANIMKHDLQRYRDLGMADCLGKPFVGKELWSCLLKFLKPVKWIPLDGRSENGDDAIGKPELDKAGLQNALDGLDSLLQAGDSQALDHLDTLREVLAPLGRDGSLLVNQVESYDFEDAIRTVRDIRRKLERLS